MNYSELDVSKLNDNDIYDLIMTGIIDFSKTEPTEENNPDFLVVLGCSPSPLKARIVKMMELYQKGFGKYVLLSGGTGWHKLFKPQNKTFTSDKERFEYMKAIASKRNSMKAALHSTIPDYLRPPETNPKHGKGLYRYMHKKLEQSLEQPEAFIGYRIMQACKDIIHIDDDKIFFEPASINTTQNLAFSKNLLDTLQASGQVDLIKRIMIVTSSFHCRRAELSFKKYFPGIEVMSCPATLDITNNGLSFDKKVLMQDPYYMQQFRNELNAIVNYSRNGSISDLRIEDILDPKRANSIRAKVKGNTVLGEDEGIR